jgi:hypothetical protein
MTSMSEALSRLSQRMPRVVREHEVLRVAGRMLQDNASEAAETAIKEVLKWAERRCGGRLPTEAWRHETFEYFSGGRNSNCVRLKSDGSDLWAIRADDPDKNVAERIWTTEVVIGLVPNQRARFSARLLVSTPENELLIEPHTPGFVQQVAETCHLARGKYLLSAEPMRVESQDEAVDLISHLVDPQREMPTFVITLPSDADIAHPNLDVEGLCRAMLGIAHVAVINASMTWYLTERFGRIRSVFGGAARVYLPGFTEADDPYSHRLVLADQINTQEGAVRCVRWMRQLAAGESVRRTKLGRDVLAFSDIRNASLQLRQEALENEGASDTEQLKAANDRIAALKADIEQKTTEQNYYVEEYEREHERAELAEKKAQTAAYRIRELTELLRSRGDDPDRDIPIPTSWDALPDWCDEHLSGRLALTSPARRGAKDPEFRDVETAARCLLWLATNGREQRINGSGAPMSNVTIMEGIQNASCGSDTYEFDWNGRRFSADRHIKNGGNTRDPSRCLRIYYCFDEQTQQIIVSHMPAHRRTEAS